MLNEKITIILDIFVPPGPVGRHPAVPVARAQAGFKQERSEDLGVARVEETQF